MNDIGGVASYDLIPNKRMKVKRRTHRSGHRDTDITVQNVT